MPKLRTRTTIMPALILLLAALLIFTHAFPVQAGKKTTWLPAVMAPGSSAPIHHGEATYYTFANGDGNCMFGPSPDDLLVAAMNAVEYDTAAVCGEYVHITGPKGQVTVRIVDQCPECAAGALDLSPQAFVQIADLVQGRVPITWQVASGNLTTPIAYHFKEGSNPWWTAVQVRNHNNPIAKFEYLGSGGQWISVPRTDYNFFKEDNGMGDGPFTFRVTDSYGNTLIDSGIPLSVGLTVSGSGQFPPKP